MEITNHSTSEVTVDSSSGSHYLIENLTHGTNYSYRVKAFDNAGNISGWSSQESSIQDINKPTTPVLNPEPAQTEGTSNRISWSGSTDDLSDVLYWVQCSPDTLFDNDSTTAECYKEAGWISGTAKTFDGLSLDTKYYYRVKARDEAGNETEWSAIDSSVQYENTSFSTFYVSPDGSDS
ncbi:MAG: fibronectin type III domain-containing protein [Melioribacteraceae bacterium]|nr:fibronectin type III domain-containing protein [Melioribacteraceae bacterium]